MHCPMDVRENAGRLLEYVSGKMDAESAAAFKKHVDGCPACRSSVRSQEAVWRSLDSWEAAPVSPDFDARLRRRMERQVSWWERTVLPFRPIMPVAAAAAVLLMAGFGLLIERPAAPPSAPPPATAQMEELAPDQVAGALDDMEMIGEFSHLVRMEATEPKM